MRAKNVCPQVESLCDEYQPYVVSLRRDFHRHAEVGFTEFRTASIVAKELQKSGFEVLIGDEVNNRESMINIPSASYMDICMKRAIDDGANPELIKRMQGGLTGIVGVLRCGEGPVFAVRFDMDALEMTESDDQAHRPAREGFASKNPGACHSCGHDGHIAIGLGVARVISQIRHHLKGTVKLIFQPAEEGIRGARPMVDAGVVDDVDYFMFSHLGVKLRETGTIATTSSITSTTKFHIDFTGVAAHPVMSPEKGRNALIAASIVALALHSLPPVGEGSGFRIVNVGVLNSGLAQGVISPNAHIEVATFASCESLNADLVEKVNNMVEGAKMMFGVSASVRKVGESFSAMCDPEMVDIVKRVAQKISPIKRVDPPIPLGGAEDAAYFMRKVQARGGKACCVVIGAGLSAEHHHPYFDFDEKALDVGTRLIASVAVEVLSGSCY